MLPSLKRHSTDVSIIVLFFYVTGHENARGSRTLRHGTLLRRSATDTSQCKYTLIDLLVNKKKSGGQFSQIGFSIKMRKINISFGMMIFGMIWNDGIMFYDNYD